MTQMSKAEQSLAGKRIVLTRNKNQNRELKDKIEALGGVVLELPLIDIAPCYDEETLNDVFAEFGAYAWIVFTSQNGVNYFFDSFLKKFKDIRSIGAVQIACIGESTADAVRKYHLEVDYTPQEALSEKLAEGLVALQSLDNEKILVITGNLNRDLLFKKLEAEGHAIVDTLQVYETKNTDLSYNADAVDFRKKGADVVFFASSSAVNSFVQQAKHLKLATKALKPLTCSIGSVTSQTMKAVGIPVDIEAKEPTLEGIIAALQAKWD